MHMKQKSLQYELRDFFMETFVYQTNVISENIASIANKIKMLLSAKEVHIYLYNQWKDNFELHHQTEHKMPQFENNPLTDVLDRSLYESISTEIICLENGNVVENASYCQTYLTPLVASINEKPLGFVYLEFDEQVPITTYKQKLKDVASETYKFINGFSNYVTNKEMANKYELLYRVTAKFHSSIDTKDVLSEVINTLSEVYPQFKYSLFLSQDYQDDWMLPIRELKYTKDYINESSVQCFLTGRVQIERSKEKSRLNAPLKGKQGIYGVLQIAAPITFLFPDSDVEFITLLANTAGNALENAKLFQQSKQLISDLQLINETSHALNSNLRLTETTSFMNKQIKKSFGAEELGFILFKEDRDEMLEGSTSFFSSNDSASFLDVIIPMVKESRDSLFISDFSNKFPKKNFRYQSVMAIPMIQSDQIKGAIIVLHQEAYFFSFESFKLIQSLVHHSTLAFVNSLLREQLEQLVITDYLTKLYSRKYLDERLQEHLETEQQGVFILIDIDDFKKINDFYGHEMGDKLLIQVSNIIKINLGRDDFAARWGGEELAIYMPQSTIEDGYKTAEQIVRQVETYTKPSITISAGVAYWSKEKPIKAKEIFDLADIAMYKAKKAGKNCAIKAN